MSYEIGDLILFHDDEGNVNETAIVISSRTLEHSEHYYPSYVKEKIYKIHLLEEDRILEFPEYHLKLRASSRKEYREKYGF